MEIDTKITASGINNLTSAKLAKAASPPAPDNNSFAKSAALEAALKNTPDIRASAVDRAKILISDPNYPSPAAIKKLAHFLADKLTSNPD